MDHNKPYPELVEPPPAGGGERPPYDVRDTRDGEGRVSIEKRLFYVSLRDGWHGVARHELAHVRWSPAEILDDVDAVLLAVEDARVNLGMRALDLPVYHTDPDGGHASLTELALEDIQHGRVGRFIVRCVSAIGTDVAGVLERFVAEELKCPGSVMLKQTRRVTALVERRLLDERAPGCALAPHASARRLADEIRRLFREWAVELPLLPGDELAVPGGSTVGEATTDPSGEMSVVRAEMPHVVPPARTRPGRPTEEGCVPRLMHRWPLDMAVFRGPRRASVARGSVLIDHSGSMHLESSQIDAILRVARCAVVAVYSGQKERGELRVVADGGRRADVKDLNRYGNGNIVDEPALAWLAEQVEPRVWVSDGGVTGVEDACSARVSQACAQIQREGRITRVADIKKVPAMLAGALPR